MGRILIVLSLVFFSFSALADVTRITKQFNSSTNQYRVNIYIDGVKVGHHDSAAHATRELADAAFGSTLFTAISRFTTEADKFRLKTTLNLHSDIPNYRRLDSAGPHQLTAGTEYTRTDILGALTTANVQGYHKGTKDGLDSAVSQANATNNLSATISGNTITYTVNTTGNSEYTSDAHTSRHNNGGLGYNNLSVRHNSATVNSNLDLRTEIAIASANGVEAGFRAGRTDVIDTVDRHKRGLTGFVNNGPGSGSFIDWAADAHRHGRGGRQQAMTGTVHFESYNSSPPNIDGNDYTWENNRGGTYNPRHTYNVNTKIQETPGYNNVNNNRYIRRTNDNTYIATGLHTHPSLSNGRDTHNRGRLSWELHQNIAAAIETAFEDGYDTGYRDGYNDGYTDGFRDGVTSVHAQ